MKRFHLLLCLWLFSAMTHADGLHILLTNDDGYDTPGIRALRTALIEDGHRVTLAGPAQNASGQSAAISFGTLTVKQTEPGVYAVEGTPATCVLVGVTGILPPEQRPDLVISGINEGANLGVLSAFSGTVGATVAGLHLAKPGIPGIAISTDLIDGDPRSPANLAHSAAIADFIARLVARLQQERARNDGPLLPAGLALNINYPPLAREQIKGVGIYRHGRVAPIGMRFEQNDDGQWKPHLRRVTDGDGEVAQADTTAYRQGYITVVPIDGDYTAPDWPPALALPGLEQLSP